LICSQCRKEITLVRRQPMKQYVSRAVVPLSRSRGFLNNYIKSVFLLQHPRGLVIAVRFSGPSSPGLLNSPLRPRTGAGVACFREAIHVGDVEGYTPEASHLGRKIVPHHGRFWDSRRHGRPAGAVMGLNPKIYNRTHSIIEPVPVYSPNSLDPALHRGFDWFSRYVF